MPQIVRVRLRKPTRIFMFLSRDIAVKPGESCVVRSDRGLEFGVCVTPPEECTEEEASEYTLTLQRKANYNDENNFKQILIDEEIAKALCAGKIIERNLPMRLVNVEYTLDRHKVIFYFTAEDRVDFRDLVRDLAHELKTRIELRHIQVRDKSKFVGGLAACGRELCCSTWLPDFMPISMKMAKRQNLSLNPSKISGQCGRLMCCLGYENYHYCEKKKQKPAAEAAAGKTEPAAGEEWPAEDEAILAEAEEEDLEFAAEDAAGPGETVYVEDPELGVVVNDPLPVGDASTDQEGGKKAGRNRRRPRRRRKRGKGAGDSQGQNSPSA